MYLSRENTHGDRPSDDPPHAALAGVYAAVPTPLEPSSGASAWRPSARRLLPHLRTLPPHLHGAVVLGTTGEGPSFGLLERERFIADVAGLRGELPDGFRLIAGTGAASLADSAALTARAFEQDYDAVLVVPPFYFRSASSTGLADWYSRLIDASVPPGGRVLVYHIPPVSGVAIELGVLETLATRFPKELAGLKDSGGNIGFTQSVTQSLPQLAVFTGNDSHLAACLRAGGSGSITALANIAAPLVRQVYDESRQTDAAADALADQLSRARSVLERYPSVPAIKAWMADTRGTPAAEAESAWRPYPPLEPLAPDERRRLFRQLDDALGPAQ